MADSYVSKPGIRGLDTDSPTCGRTHENYPSAIAAGLGLSPGEGLTDVSCAATTTDELTQERESIGDPIPPQLDAVTEDTDLVTISTGENNLDFFAKTIAACLPIDLLGPAEGLCREQGHFQEPIIGDDGFSRVRDSVHAGLTNAARAIKDKAPNAKIVFVGYPQMLPAVECAGTLPMAKGDMAWINGRLRGINQTIQQVANETGQTYVDIYGPSAGHGICAEGPAWEAGLLTVNPLESQPLHLTPLGAQEIGKIVLSKI